ncbi:DUF2512 family protein [Clostridium sp.]|uniref:DUF2512 family protein n=1 Tax=Clostridium sp. TaxID=1506 RepID=UPI002841DA91|nr:DUF2512 family protein [Clostridium sp.]MDR3598687.1 DUF2512 family protein [Clostridium sp.]
MFVIIGLILKFIACPVIIILSNYVIGLEYSVIQGLFIGVVLAFVAHMMEVLILKHGTLWISTISDFIVAFAVVYLSQFVLRDVNITFFNAFLTSLLLTVVEYLEHIFLIRSGKTKKGE